MTVINQTHKIFAVVLAGGSGTRFWPKSRHLTPKQLCKIGDPEKTMIELTLERLNGFIPPERRFIVTHTDQAALTRQIVKDQCAAVIAEPFARNTAAALALAALEVKARAGNDETAIMISLHADAVISDRKEFLAALQRGIEIAEQGQIGLIGIVPKYPETGFGYIERGEPFNATSRKYRVASFREKPNLHTATEYVKSGRFYWNAGIFVWQVSTVIKELQQYYPQTIQPLTQLFKEYENLGVKEIPWDKLKSLYAQLPEVSIDTAVMEKSKLVMVTDADIGWQDVGSWAALADCVTPDQNGNIVQGDAFLLDSNDCTVDSDGPFIGCIGIQDLVVVAAKGAILVCPKNRAQEVKNIVVWLKENGRKELI